MNLRNKVVFFLIWTLSFFVCLFYCGFDRVTLLKMRFLTKMTEFQFRDSIPSYGLRVLSKIQVLNCSFESGFRVSRKDFQSWLGFHFFLKITYSTEATCWLAHYSSDFSFLLILLCQWQHLCLRVCVFMRACPGTSACARTAASTSRWSISGRSRWARCIAF